MQVVKFGFLLGVCLLATLGAAQRLPRLACYYGTWARYSGLTPDKIDPDLCTSILISFVGVSDTLTDIRPFDPDDARQVFPAMRALRERSTNGLKLVIALGGASHDNSKFDRMIADQSKLLLFAENTVKTIREMGMDGIDVDWEFPKDPEEHVKFIGTLRAAIDTEVLSERQERLELSAALSAGSYIKSYNISLIGSLLDIGYVMTYDYHGPWEKITGHNSPLHPRQDDVNQNLNTEWTLNHYYLNGFPKEKIFIGIPTYSRIFNLRSPTVNGVGAPFLGGSTKPYPYVCSAIRRATAVDRWDGESQVPYAVDGTEWISYASIRSVANTCQWAQKNGFAGAMVWSLHQDDFSGECGEGTFPLVRALKACSQTFPTPAPPPSTPTPTVVTPSAMCQSGSDGFREIPGDCEKFIQCAGGRAFIHSCQRGLHFTLRCTCCNYPSLAGRDDCDGIVESTAASTTTSPSTSAATTSSTSASTSSPSTSAATTSAPTSPTVTVPSTTAPGGTTFAGQVDNIACYYGTWGRYSGLKPEAIDPTLCTSVLISFVQVRDDLLNIAPFDASDVNDVFPPLIQMKRQYGLKLVIALGGASHANYRFDNMIANPATLASFAANTVQQLRSWEMDGLDVDWEFPTNKAEHVLFLKALRKAFDEEVREPGVEKLELSAALPAGHYIANYDIAQVGKLLDIGYVMAYDYHGPWESFTGHNSPLFARRDDIDQKLNTNWTIWTWVNGGLPKEKLYVGVPTYARTFRVADPEATGVGVGVRAFGIQTLTYRQVCNNVLSKPTTRQFWDGQSMVPYAVDGDIWVSYANGTSLANKCHYTDVNGFGGLMVWSLHQDDYDGTCGGGTLGLVRALKACSGQLPAPTPLPPTSPTTTRSTTTTTTPAPVTGTIDNTFCANRAAGFYEIYGDCSNFIRCDGGVTFSFTCQTGLHFSLKCTCCEFPEVADRSDCDAKGASNFSPTTPTSQVSTGIPRSDTQYCAGKPDGNHPVTGECATYYTCSNGHTYRGHCEYPTLFNPRCNCCDKRAQTLIARDDCIL